MSPTELLLARIINMGGREFVSKDVCYPEYGMSINNLRSSFKRFVTNEAVEVSREEKEGGHTVYYYRVNRYRLRLYMDNVRVYNKAPKVSHSVHSDGWKGIWPEFFVDPKFSGKKRVFKQVEV